MRGIKLFFFMSILLNVASAFALEESEIPVKIVQRAEGSAAAGANANLMFGLGAVILVAGGALWAIKRYAFKNRESAKNSIKMLTQYHLGPRKSLAIVQVAGEAILIGVTDHHIGLIKPLSLLDDEVPQLEGKDFETLSQEKKIEAELGEDFKLDLKDEFKVTGLKQLGRGLR